MTITTIGNCKAITRTAAVAAASGCAMFSLAAPALADASGSEDLLTGGNFCSTTAPFTCDPTHLNLTVPAGANAVQLSFTPNPGNCAGLTVNVFEGGTAYPLNQNVATTPGVHNVAVIPTCSQQFDSWGGTVHVFYIKTVGATPQQGPTVNADVQLFDTPGGSGNQIGQLNNGDAVQLLGACPLKNPNNADDPNNGWCNVTDTTLNVTGWVWHDYIKQ